VEKGLGRAVILVIFPALFGGKKSMKARGFSRGRIGDDG
jgi:hypothetical protein